ncbi:MAG TPA: UDP-N-acetylmuramate--L-alanine ligase [Anaerolineaceae bacterium]|nr:UDP-N-acetylmuramate--L-alanine ligase [Anaerolineaceae bacterium]HPN51471.1 UDP-N-acetylmuramate--L-alanine ligase [Anaerolineaceae bacterium]
MTHVHLLGISGSGLSAIARVLLERGYTVSGCDRTITALGAALQEAGAAVTAGHDPAHLSGVDLAVRSSAVPESNLEVQAALAAGIPVYKRERFLRWLMQDQRGVAVAGTHGKTTTTAMLAWLFTRLGQDPSFIVGGVVRNLNANAHAGQGEWFVIEADEYDHTFLGLEPQFAVITNIEHDHPDCYPTAAEYEQAFADFAHCVQPGGELVLCAENPGCQRLAGRLQAEGRSFVTYALEGEADFTAADLQVNDNGGLSFAMRLHGQTLAQVRLAVPGRHNALNALGALSLVQRAGLDVVRAAAELEAFCGSGRRFEVRGEAWGVTVVDDYAHHPTEIRATLAAARLRFPGRRVWALWQPHTFSRLVMLKDEFAAAFKDADRVIVTGVYGARESGGAFSSADLVKQMAHPDARCLATLDEAEAALAAELKPGDALLVLSAGDADQLSGRLLKTLQDRV